jgi:hypothetical protein
MELGGSKVLDEVKAGLSCEPLYVADTRQPWCAHVLDALDEARNACVSMPSRDELMEPLRVTYGEQIDIECSRAGLSCRVT